jgi:hypothetical protein
MIEPLWQLSAVEVAAGIRGKRFPCSELMASTVERIHALNPKLNAIVIDLTDQALAEAAAADHRLRSLEDPGPLFGVPVTIKVNVDQEGRRRIHCMAACGTRGIQTRRRVDRPAVPGLPRRRVSALFITATTLVVRYGSRHSPTARRRSSQPRVETPHSILLQQSNAACSRSLHRYKVQSPARWQMYVSQLE